TSALPATLNGARHASLGMLSLFGAVLGVATSLQRAAVALRRMRFCICAMQLAFRGNRTYQVSRAPHMRYPVRPAEVIFCPMLAHSALRGPFGGLEASSSMLWTAADLF